MADFLIFTAGLPEWLAWSVTAGVAAFLVLNVIAGGALVFIWAERKIAARIQDRLGPTRTGGRFGWLQSLADGIKLLAKEDLMPAGADGMLFKLAPYVSFCASFCGFHRSAIRVRFCWPTAQRGRFLCRCGAGLGGVWSDSGWLCIGF